MVAVEKLHTIHKYELRKFLTYIVDARYDVD